MVLIPYMLVRILDDMTDFVDQDYWGWRTFIITDRRLVAKVICRIYSFVCLFISGWKKTKNVPIQEYINLTNRTKQQEKQIIEWNLETQGKLAQNNILFPDKYKQLALLINSTLKIPNWRPAISRFCVTS